MASKLIDLQDFDAAFAQLTGTDGDDTLDGTAQNDTLSGLAGNDTLSGNDGNDVINGGDGNDTLIGNGGNDTLNGGTGTDSMVGGDGDDLFVIGFAEHVSGAPIHGGAGSDTIVFANTSFFSTFLILGDGSGQLSGVEVVRLSGNKADGVDAFFVTNSSLEIIGNGAANELEGGGGNDTLTGGLGADSLVGGIGADFMLIGSLAELAGDTMDGGTGSDTLRYTGATALNLVLTANISSVEAVQLANATAAINIDASAVGNGIALEGNNAANILTGTTQNDTLMGNGGNDTLTGGAGDDAQHGGDGNDIFNLASALDLGGDETINGGAGTDVIHYTSAVVDETLELSGGTAVEQVLIVTQGIELNVDASFAASEMTIVGNNVSNTLLAAVSFGTTLMGNAGDDTLAGSNSNDILDGGAGADDMLGGAGDDIFLIASQADYAPGEVINGGNDDDTIRFTKTTTTGGATFTLTGAVLQVEAAQLANAAGATTGTAALNLDASAVGTAMALEGNNGANTLTGTGQNDTLIGNAGNDTLVAGGGADSLVGGAGNDTYRVEAALLDVVVEDTAAGGGMDTVIIQNLTSAYAMDGGVENLILNTSEGGYQVTGNDASNTIRDETIYNHFLHGGEAGADTLVAGAGDDTLEGGGGIDSLVGGIGNDLYRMSVSAGSLGGDVIVEAANEGTDSLRLDLGGSGGLTYVLHAQVENVLALNTAGGLIKVTGNALDNILNASSVAGALQFDGGAGDDLLTTDATTNDTFLGGAGNDTLVAGGSGDVLNGGTGDDNLNGGTGSDTLTGGQGNDALDGGVDGDYVAFTGATAAVAVNLGAGTVSGGGAGFGVDSVTFIEGAIGTAFNDTLLGSAGGDTLIGGAGRDLAQAGDENDTIIIASAAEHVGDTLDGGGGTEDRLLFTSPTAANLVLNANTQGIEDIYIMNASGDAGGTAAIGIDARALSSGVSIFGNHGANLLIGTQFSDNIAGDAGLDNLQGGDGNDGLSGGAGNDVMTGGAGGDEMFGDEGDDVFLIAQGAHNGPADFMDGGAGSNVIRFTATTIDALTLYFAEEITEVEASDAAGGNAGTAALSIDAGDLGFGLKITGNNGANTLAGSGFADQIVGNGGNDTLIGNNGNDSLDGGAGMDTADYSGGFSPVTVDLGATLVLAQAGELGNDTLVGIENVIGGSAGDTLTGSNNLTVGNLLDGGAGADSLAGNAGNDTLVGGEDLDTVDGGAGNDLFLIADDNDYTGSESIIGGVGTDVIRFTSSSNNQFLILAAGVQVEQIQVATAAGVTTGTNSVSVNASGMTGPLVIIGNNGANFILATAQNDNINGNGGNDIVSAGAGNDMVIGGNGDDTLQGGAGNDTLNGGAGIDLWSFSGADAAVNASLATNTASGGAGSIGVDTLLAIEGIIGSGFDDTVTGSAGNNFLDGGPGNDSVSGGAGNDTLDGHTGDDTLNGGAGIDTANYSIQAGPDSLTVNLGADAPILATTGEFGTDTLIDIENIVGGGGDDTITGSAVGNVLEGGEGDDRLTGAGGNDSLVGGDDNDPLFGGAGNDTLVGGAGIDGMFGDDGNDVFLIGAGGDHLGTESANGGNDTDVVRFTSTTSNDTLTLNFNVVVEQVVIGDAAGSILGTTALNLMATAVENGLSIVGNNGANNVAGTVYNDTINGNAGNDTLAGDTGADSVLGGTGNDTLIGGQGTDTLLGGAGNDSYQLNVGVGNLEDLDDRITEALNQGTDEVRVAGDGNVAVAYTLPANVENATIYNLGTFTGTLNGNALNNLLILLGEGGGAVLNGDAGNDTLIGDTGNDTLNGGVGNDSLVGGALTDTFIGGAGVDRLLGQDGSDIFLYAAPGDFSPGEVVDGGAGDDFLRFTSTTAGQTLVLSGSVQVELVSISSATNDPSGTTALNVNAAGVTGNGLDILGNMGANSIVGTGMADYLHGNGGNDTLNGGAGNDLLDGGVGLDNLQGGLGDDRIALSAFIDELFSGEKINGGGGNADLLFFGNPEVLDLTALANDRILGIEIIDITSDADSTLTLNLQDLLALSDTTNVLRVDGDAGDTVISTGQGWTAGAQQVIGLNTYNSYTSGTGTLLIDTDITQTNVT